MDRLTERRERSQEIQKAISDRLRGAIKKSYITHLRKFADSDACISDKTMQRVVVDAVLYELKLFFSGQHSQFEEKSLVSMAVGVLELSKSFYKGAQTRLIAELQALSLVELVRILFPKFPTIDQNIEQIYLADIVSLAEAKINHPDKAEREIARILLGRYTRIYSK